MPLDMQEVEEEKMRKVKRLIKFLKKNWGKMYSGEELKSLGFEPEYYVAYNPLVFHEIDTKLVDGKLYYYYRMDSYNKFFWMVISALLGFFIALKSFWLALLVIALIWGLIMFYNEVIFFKGVENDFGYKRS
ncbi:MAG: hypothetical protein ACXQTS_02580 [Candidatus Methanospirareceae archaeon]